MGELVKPAGIADGNLKTSPVCGSRNEPWHDAPRACLQRAKVYVFADMYSVDCLIDSQWKTYP